MRKTETFRGMIGSLKDSEMERVCFTSDVKGTGVGRHGTGIGSY